MLHVWVYSIGPEPPPQFLGLPFMDCVVRAIRNELESWNKQIVSVGIWNPYGFETWHRDEPKCIVLLVSDWREFTRNDFFAGSTALALHESGAAHVLPVLLAQTTNETGDIWSVRYQRLWERLAQIAIGESASAPSLNWWEQLTFALREQFGSTSTDASPPPKPVSLFLSYTHHDEKLRNGLARHLKLLERAGLLEVWHDRNIQAGEDWATEIDSHLFTADLIVLLLSADFFASDYCYEIEASVALKRHQEQAARAIPVLLRPVAWQHSPLNALQALPTNGRPVTVWKSVDAAFVDICEGIDIAGALLGHCWGIP